MLFADQRYIQYVLNKYTWLNDAIYVWPASAETDPIFVASPAFTITYADIAFWNLWWWGEPLFTAWLAAPPNISTFTNDAGYITSWWPETDPVFSAWLLTNPLDWFVPYVWAVNDVIIWEHSVIVTNDWVITRDLDDLFYDVTLSSGRVMTATRDIDKRISTLFDWVRTRTFTRTAGRITSRTVTP